MCLCGCVDRDRVVRTFVDDLISEKCLTSADVPNVSLVFMKTGRRLFRISNASTTPLSVMAEWRNLADEIEKDPHILYFSGWSELVELDELKDFDLRDTRKTSFANFSVLSKQSAFYTVFQTEALKEANEVLVWVNK